jgi:hypothetical protein
MEPLLHFPSIGKLLSDFSKAWKVCLRASTGRAERRRSLAWILLKVLDGRYVSFLSNAAPSLGWCAGKISRGRNMAGVAAIFVDPIATAAGTGLSSVKVSVEGTVPTRSWDSDG